MSTKSNAISTKVRRARRAPGSAARSLVVCLRNDGYEVALEPRKFYAVVRDSSAAKHDQLRVIDESGEDYLFPASLFATIPVPHRGRPNRCRPD